MKRVAWLVLAVVLAGCWQRRDEALDVYARMKRDADAKRDAERQDLERQRAELARQHREREAAEVKREEPKREPEPDLCESTRAERIEATKEQVKAWLELLKKHGEWALDHCDVVDTRGTLVSTERTPEGVIVRTRQVGSEAEIKCKGVRPKSLTDEQLEAILFATNDTVVGEPYMPCVESDRAAGFEPVIRVTDAEAMKALLGR